MTLLLLAAWKCVPWYSSGVYLPVRDFHRTRKMARRRMSERLEPSGYGVNISNKHVPPILWKYSLTGWTVCTGVRKAAYQPAVVVGLASLPFASCYHLLDRAGRFSTGTRAPRQHRDGDGSHHYEHESMNGRMLKWIPHYSSPERQIGPWYLACIWQAPVIRMRRSKYWLIPLWSKI